MTVERHEPRTKTRRTAANTVSEESTDQSAKQQCFVVAPIGPADSEVRKRSDQIFKHIIGPAAEAHSFALSRADMMDQSGSITTQIINQVINSSMVVADLTGHNPNVFYELAVRHAAAKPFVQIIQEGETIPFDIANYRTIFLDYKDLDSAASARDQLIRMFGDSLAAEGSRVDTPITQSVDFEGLRASGDPQHREIALLSAQVQQMSQLVSRRLRTSEEDPDTNALRRFVATLATEGRLQSSDLDVLITNVTTPDFDRWVRSLAPTRRTGRTNDDPWATSANDEPPF